jgi:glycosidase
VSEAKEKGIGILLDGVFNHTGSDSVYFNQKGRFPSIGAAQSPDSPYYSWYHFYSYPDSYECWWNIDILPRINPGEPSCAAYFVGEGGIIDRWASIGIAGMRLDVADELPDDFIANIKARLSLKNPESLLYGEVWEDASNKIAYDKRKQYYLGNELDGAMNYPLRDGILRYLREGNVSSMRYYIDEVMPNTPRRILHTQMNLIGTHDTLRAITALVGESPEGHTNAELFEKSQKA